MPTITLHVERHMPCPCLALSSTPFGSCAECAGDGRSWQEIPVQVDYDYSPPCPGSRERGTGLALEPDEPESIEITSSTVDLDRRELERAADAARRDVEDRLKESL